VTARLATLLVAVACVLIASSTALADGDPASDTLLQLDVFLPYPPPDTGASQPLQKAVDAAYARGYRVKVAIVATPTDLGAIPSLFGKPAEYAHFLGSELNFVYVGPLLIVMPAGFGVWDGGRSTAAEEHVLAGQKIGGNTPEELTRAAMAAVLALTAAGALKSKDVTPPYVQALPAAGVRGKTAKLEYYVGDDSKRAAVTIQVQSGGRALATIKVPLATVQLGQIYKTSWAVPRKLAKGVIQFCIVGTDPSRNRSPKACAPLTIR
jgi:hypothetical protein